MGNCWADGGGGGLLPGCPRGLFCSPQHKIQPCEERKGPGTPRIPGREVATLTLAFTIIGLKQKCLQVLTSLDGFS